MSVRMSTIRSMTAACIAMACLSWSIIGSSVPAIAKATTVTVLLGPSISGIEMVKDIVEKWDKQKTGINIKVDVAPPMSPAEVLTPRAAGGVLPDLYFDMPVAPLVSFTKAGMLYSWDKFPDYWKVLDKRGTYEFAKDFVIGGMSYLLPWQVETVAMIWNQTMLSNIGVANPPKDYSGFFSVGDKLKARGIALMSLNAASYWDSRIGDFYNTYLAASSGRTLLKNGKPDMNNPIANTVLKMFVDLQGRGYTPPPGPIDAWGAQKLVMKYTGPGDRAYLDAVKFPWTATNWIVPDDYAGPQPPYVYANLKGIVMFKESKQKDEAWEFVKFFIGSQADMVTLSYGRMPVRDTLADDPDFDAWWQLNPKYRIFARQMKRMKTLDMVPKVERMMTAVDEEFMAAINRMKTVKEALMSLDKKLAKLL